MLISLIFVSLSAICDAFCDKVETIISYNTSSFRKLNPLFWSKVGSSKNKFISGTKYRPDAWHLSKSLRVIFFAISCILSVTVDNIKYCNTAMTMVIYLTLIGLVWNLTFNAFYNYVFNSDYTPIAIFNRFRNNILKTIKSWKLLYIFVKTKNTRQ